MNNWLKYGFETLVDHGFTKDVTIGHLELEFSLDVEPFKGAEELILSQLKNTDVRFNLQNLMVIRGRLSSLQISLLEKLNAENLQLIRQLKDILNQ